jgi:uncharacterized phiE125 gp8 family phage protein
MTVRLITAPLVEPISLPMAKSFLRVDGTDDDLLITSLIHSAREKGEEISRRAFITQTLEMTVDDWPETFTLRILRPRLQSVVSVVYRDWYGVEHAWTNYLVDNKSEPGQVIFHIRPGVNLLETGALTVRFIAGYGDTEASVPEKIKQAILQLVTYWYEMRVVGDVPAEIRAAFMSERVVWF